MKIRIRYVNETETLGYNYIDLRTDFEKDIQETGRKLGATRAWSENNSQTWGIKYDDKINSKGSKRGVE